MLQPSGYVTFQLDQQEFFGRPTCMFHSVAESWLHTGSQSDSVCWRAL
jgi:hypothetical protein